MTKSAEMLVQSKAAEKLRKRALSAYIMSSMAAQRMKNPALTALLEEKGIFIDSKDLGARIRSGVMSGFLLTYILEILGANDAIEQIEKLTQQLSK